MFSRCKSRMFATRLNMNDLKNAIAKHGEDLVKLRQEFPSRTTQILKERLADLRTKREKGTPFTLEEDIEILTNQLSGGAGRKGRETWAQLSIRLGRRFHSTRYRYYNHIKLNSIQNGAKLKDDFSFEVLLRKERIRLAKLLESGHTIDNSPKMKKVWTFEMDTHLLDTLKKIGPAFSLFTRDFPQFSAYEIRNRFNHLSSKVFLPHEDEIIRGLIPQKRAISERVMKLLPHHSINYIWRRKKVLMEGRVSLSASDIANISENVKNHGREYLNIPKNEFIIDRNWTCLQLKKEWAKLEPENQVNAIWTFERDSELMRYWNSSSSKDKGTKKEILIKRSSLDWSGFGSKEIETRLAVLQRSPLDHHVQRRQMILESA